MFKFLHAADIHLDSPLKGLAEHEGAPVDDIRGATRRALENLVRIAIEEEAAFVLLAGDLYDGTWKDYNTGLFFATQMAVLKEAGIRVIVAAGNHDAASQITRMLRPPRNVRFLSTKAPETRILEDCDVAVHGQGFATRAVDEDLAAGFPIADPHLFTIGLLHTSLDGRPGHDPYAPCSLDMLRSKGYGYWALGHVHAREVVAQDPWVVFPGNTQGRHVRETGAKGCALVTVEDQAVRSVKHRELDVLRWALCPVDITDVDTPHAALDLAGKALRNELHQADGRPVAARLVLEGRSKAHEALCARPEHWTEEARALAIDLGGAGVWVERLVTRTESARQTAAALARDDALGSLLRGIRDLDAHPERVAGFATEFADLKRKLPAEFLAAEDPLDPTSSEVLRALVEEVKELLLSQLLVGEAPS